MTSTRSVTARNQLPRRDTGAPDQCTQKLRPGPWRGEGSLNRGRVRSSSSWLPELLRLGKAQNAGPAESVVLWSTQKPEPEWLRPGKCTQRRARSRESSPEPDQCRRGKHTGRQRGQSQCGRSTTSAPHTPQCYLSAVPPSPQCDLTSEPKQETTSARWCQGGS